MGLHHLDPEHTTEPCGYCGGYPQDAEGFGCSHCNGSGVVEREPEIRVANYQSLGGETHWTWTTRKTLRLRTKAGFRTESEAVTDARDTLKEAK